MDSVCLKSHEMHFEWKVSTACVYFTVVYIFDYAAQDPDSPEYDDLSFCSKTMTQWDLLQVTDALSKFLAKQPRNASVPMLRTQVQSIGISSC